MRKGRFGAVLCLYPILAFTGVILHQPLLCALFFLLALLAERDEWASRQSLQALALGLVALTLSFGRTTGKLGDRLTALESRVEELEARLDPSVPLVADAQISSRSYSYPQGTQGTTITVSLTPGELREDLELTLSYVRDSDGYSREHEFTQEAGGTYRTSFFSAGGDCPFTLTALISTGGRTYTQPLFRVLSVEAGTILYDELWRETAS